MLNEIVSSLSHKEEGMVLDHNPIREAQIDTDGIFYAVAKPYDNTLKTDLDECVRHAEWLVKASGSAYGVLHSTQALKGGREQMAWHHPYQSKRHGYQDETYIARVRQLRKSFLGVQTDILISAPQFFIEADDSMTTRHLQRIKEYNDYTASIIITSDKDLNMTMGDIMNARSHIVTSCGEWTGSTWEKTWGWCKWAKGGTSTNKLIGRGRAFFWAQMLAGDTTDTIQGIGEMPREIIEALKPRKRGKQRGAPFKRVGGALASEMITLCSNEQRALQFVRRAYTAYYKEWGDFFLFEMAFLLWMRESNKATDCLTYLNGLGFSYTLHEQQVKALNKYLELCGMEQEKLNNG